MAALKDRLQADLTAAMRSKDEVRKATVRMTLAAITHAEVAGKEARQLSDDEVMTVLTREAKRRREAAEAFRDAGRTDSAEREEAEAAIIAEYLPDPLTDTELDQLVSATIAETGATTPRDMGAVMKALQPKTAGRVDGGRVAAIVKTRLTAMVAR